MDALLPILYLRGVSAGDFQEALSVLLGKDAPNLSPSVIARLKESWADDYARWQQRDPIARLEKHLRDSGLLDDEAAARIAEEAEAFAAGVRQRMQSEPEVVAEEIFHHVYSAPTAQLVEQRAQLRAEQEEL